MALPEMEPIPPISRAPLSSAPLMVLPSASASASPLVLRAFATLLISAIPEMVASDATVVVCMPRPSARSRDP